MKPVTELAAYARQAVRDVGDPRERRDSEAEIYANLLARYDEELAAGLDHDQAVARCINEMGELGGLRSGLDQAHRRRFTPAAAALLICCVVGFLVLVLSLLWAVFSGLFF